jgi:hypothetical protein
VQNLTIAGRAFDDSNHDRFDISPQTVLALKTRQADDRRLHEDGLDAEWLSNIFANLTSCDHGGLEKIPIVIVVYETDTKATESPSESYTAIADHALLCSQTLSCTMQALGRTGLLVRTLNLFSDCPMGLRYGLHSASLDPRQWGYQHVPTLASLRCLSIRLVESDLPVSDPDESCVTRICAIRDFVNIAGLVAFLTACSGLQELCLTKWRTGLYDYRYWDVYQEDADFSDDSDKALQRLLRREEHDLLLSVRFPQIQILSIIGFDLAGETCDALLRKHSATLRSGTM